MVRKKQHNDGLVDGNIHSKKRPSTTKFQYPKNCKIELTYSKQWYIVSIQAQNKCLKMS